MTHWKRILGAVALVAAVLAATTFQPFDLTDLDILAIGLGAAGLALIL